MKLDMPESIEDLFLHGMKRDLPSLLAPTIDGPHLNIGAGKYHILGTHAHDLPTWDADRDLLPYPEESVAYIHCYHFLEHVREPILVLREFERVLKPRGVINVVVPHYLSSLSYQDMDHKTHFGIDAMDNLFRAPGYDKHGEWKLKVHAAFLMGVAERNLACFWQLTK